MTAGPLPQIVIARKIAVGPAHRLRHGGLALRHGDEVNVIRHQAVSPNQQTFLSAVVPEQVQVQASGQTARSANYSEFDVEVVLPNRATLSASYRRLQVQSQSAPPEW